VLDVKHIAPAADRWQGVSFQAAFCSTRKPCPASAIVLSGRTPCSLASSRRTPLEQFSYRAHAAERFSAVEGELQSHRQGTSLPSWPQSRGLHRVGSPAPEIHDSVLHTLEGELDLEEMTTRCYTTEAG